MKAPASEWLKLRDSLGEPVSLEMPALATRRPEYERPSRICLDLWLEKERSVRRAWVYAGEWYPGRVSPASYSHYFGTLLHVLNGLRSMGREEKIRLHVLSAVAAPMANRAHPVVCLLKFILAPEHAVEGSQLETVYQCPLKAFFEGFVGLSGSALEKSESIGAVAGRAVHRGYQWASRAHRRADGSDPRNDYRAALRSVWAGDFALLMRKPIDPKRGPSKEHTLPLRAEEPALRRCAERLSSGPEAVYHERLFYSPERGLSGKVDQLLVTDGRQELSEIKVSSNGVMETDPETGEAAPGGIQALTYHEALRAAGDGEIRRTRTHVEVFEESGAGFLADFRAVELSRHPLLTRIGVPLDPRDPRYVDLLAQNRNVGYAAESGLLTGYDRTKIDALLKQGRRLRGVGGSFEYFGGRPPCSYCPAQRRGICEDATRYDAQPPMPGFFRHIPDDLFEYWAWYHRQVSRELQEVKRHLHRLATTPLSRLEGEEGISLGGLRLAGQEERLVVLSREERFETRLRAGDSVLLSAGDGRPGDLYSVEARIVEMKGSEATLETLDPELPDASSFRIDRFEHIFQSRWQIQGLTDFLAGSMSHSPAQGRKIEVPELPRLSRILLGAERPALPPPVSTAHLADSLNPVQREAIGRALALPDESLMMIQGPPGTGKTKTVAALAREILLRHFWDSERKPVLILTGTHRAANEVVRKIDALYPDLRPYVLRVGRPSDSWEEEIRRYGLARMAGAEERIERHDFADPTMREIAIALKKGALRLEHAGIFVGTLGSANAEELKGLKFAYTLVDEAGQCAEPGTLQALRHMEPGYRGRLLLIGDHFQLPPVVGETEEPDPLPEILLRAGLREGETLKTSMLERLSRLYPEALVTLREQYRMNAPICRLISETFYGGALVPGTPETASATLEQWYARLGARPRLSGWMAEALDPGVPAVLLDTSGDPQARDSSVSLGGEESRENGREAELIARLLSALVASLPEGARARAADEMGVVSPYRRQNNRIRQELDERGPEETERTRVDTVDRFQGGEKPLLCVSLVSANPSASIGKLHEDWRRMNVALSRAQHKLILVGSRSVFAAKVRGETPAEAEARDRYRRLFEIFDRLVAEGSARVIRTENLG
jgi:hypothetical protein